MWLDEDIYKLIFRGEWDQLESTMDKMITDKMTIDLNVFSPFMKDIIMSNMNGTLVVTIKRSSRGCGHGENASWRLRLCKDESHWLDTLSVSNSSSINWNSWFVVIIASLNIVAKTFVKIAKTFVGLSATIIATRRRPVLILHLEEKYAKMNLREKLGKEHLDCKKSTLAKCQRSTLAKVNDS